ncbi:hypothetical protein EJ04DRAFT_179287 [Polyplosphaeria fusca]|uniref:F-box domain-containing protein n=1 Tax=Polyplosphaeria fusca TaxID=682080 RepID=A0A9P4QJ90_9PLEO|nr:hypothetical protein EJ04DRAFT_179287 [Polyplosphaeria fusca]
MSSAIVTSSRLAVEVAPPVLPMQNTLLRLPRELRDHVYSFAIPHVVFEISWDLNITRLRKNHVPGICKASRQMRDEAWPIFLQNTVWRLPHVTCSRPMSQLLYSFPRGEGFLNIRCLILQGLSVLNTNLVKYCKRLQTLVLVLDGPEIACERLVKWGVWDMDKMQKLCDLEQIFELEMLQKCVLGLQFCAELLKGTAEESTDSHSLPTWFQKRFNEKKRKVHLLCMRDMKSLDMHMAGGRPDWQKWIEELGI